MSVYIPGVYAWRSRSGSDGRLEYVTRLPLPARLLMLLFLPHCVMAIGMLGFGLYAIVAVPLGLVRDLPILVIPLLLFMGALFTPLTLLMQFGRTSVLVDRNRGEIVETTGLKFLPFVPILPFGKRKRVPLAEVRHVLLNGGTWRSGRFPCKVQFGIKDRPSLQIADCRDFLHGRALAEEVSRFTGFSVWDSTGGDPRQRPADQLDIPLVARPNAAPPAVGKPSSTFTEISGEPGRLVATTRQRPFRRGWWGAILLLAIGLVIVGTRVRYDPPARPKILLHVEYSPSDPPPPSLWPWRFGSALHWVLQGARIGGLVTAPISILALLILFFGRAPGRRLEASRDGVALTSRYLGITWRRFIPSAELEELRVDGSEHRGWILRAVSDARILKFGWGLPREELGWLCFRVWQALR